jgi:hypothetical protein
VIDQSLRLVLEGAEEPIKVDVDGRDVRAWEKENDSSFLTSTTSYIQLTWLGWHAAKRTGKTDLTYEQFDDRCIAVEDVRKAQAARPTQRRPTVVSSSA